MNIKAISTPIFKKNDDLITFITERVSRDDVSESMVLAVTSKIVSIAEKRFCALNGVESKEALIRREADEYLGEMDYGVHLTLKEGLFIASAGIDESNSQDGEYLLYPESPFLSAKDLWQRLREYWQVQELGLILTDSRTTPLRRGVTGVALAHWGFAAVDDKRGQKDLFGRELKVTTINWADALAAAATALMGEGDEGCPLALIKEAPVEFTEKTDPSEVRIPPEEDMYQRFFKYNPSR